MVRVDETTLVMEAMEIRWYPETPGLYGEPYDGYQIASYLPSEYGPYSMFETETLVEQLW
jgi:hypothetical protein